jgi:uncharacterized damage-inducible protein DinB
MDPQVLAFQFQIGSFVLDKNLAGVAHEASLLSPQPGGNTMNWIVGHVVRTRNQAVGLLGGQLLFDDAEFEQYGAGGFDPGRAMRLEELKRRFDALSPALNSALARATSEQLSVKAPFSPTANANETVGTLLASIAFHEAYHLGQTGLSRRLLGKPGALLAPGETGHQEESR